jgi:rSAM/selenodomain-associated transferase 1
MSQVDSVPRRAVGVMAKAPVSGDVKTRLCPPLALDQAAFLSAAFLRDALLTAGQVPDCRVHVVLPPESDNSVVRRLAPPGVEIEAQEGCGLAAAQRGTIRRLLNEGAQSVALIGSDLPALRSASLRQAFESLERDQSDLVLGPATDGGYYLLACRADHARLFEGISWSTDTVLAQTLARADELGLRVELLDEVIDVDDMADLQTLIELLGTQPDIEAVATRSALQALRGQGVDLPSAPIPWIVMRQRVLFESPWRSFVEEETLTHTGEASGYSYMVAPDAVWIVPVTPDGKIVLVRQYRHPVREWVLEVPAGALDGMLPADAAVKELQEEIGGRATALHCLGEVFGSSGSSTHRSHYFVAFDVELGMTAHESTEVMEILKVPAEQAFDMATRGEISDGQSSLALLMARDLVRERLA